jgi:SHS2 domain-containing protein
VYRFVDHTAELEIELESESQEGILQEALRAFAELAANGGGDPSAREVVVAARDLPGLLVAWLDELVFLAETEGFIPEMAELSLAGSEVRAALHGHVAEPRPLVKAVTLHRLRFRAEGGVWRGRVVLDV